MRSAILVVLGVAVVLLALVSYVIGLPAVFTGGLPFGAFLALLVVLNVALIVGAVVSALTRKDLTGAQRFVWIGLSILLTPVVAVGALLYFGLGRARTAELFRDLGTRSAPASPPGTPPG